MPKKSLQEWPPSCTVFFLNYLGRGLDEVASPPSLTCRTEACLAGVSSCPQGKYSTIPLVQCPFLLHSKDVSPMFRLGVP